MNVRVTESISAMVERVAANEASFGVLSIAEQIAIALVLDRKDLLDTVDGGYTMLEAVERLGIAWTRGALALQQART